MPETVQFLFCVAAVATVMSCNRCLLLELYCSIGDIKLVDLLRVMLTQDYKNYVGSKCM